MPPDRVRAIEITTAAGARRFRRSADSRWVGEAPATVVARAGGGSAFIVQFGAPNPLGASRYARVADSPDVMLLPRHGGDLWERIAAGR